MELIKRPSLTDSICDVRSRKIKQTSFTQINTLLDGHPLIKVLNKHYKKAKCAVDKPFIAVYFFSG